MSDQQPVKRFSMLKVLLPFFGMVVLVVAGLSIRASYVAEAREKVRGEEHNVESIAAAANVYRARNDDRCPTPNDLVQGSYLSAGASARDIWGSGYRIECTAIKTGAHSNGPDGLAGTSDDLDGSAYVPQKPAPSKLDVLAARVAAAHTVGQVVPIALPMLGDGLTIDNGKEVLIGWGDKRMTWSDLNTLPETTYGKVMKDPPSERGKRLCRSGSIIEISRERGFEYPVFAGGLHGDNYDVIRFVSVGDTGDLVRGSYTRICGIVTGVESYDNSGGGVTHGVVVVGMFDLPTNRARKAAQPAPAKTSGARADGWAPVTN